MLEDLSSFPVPQSERNLPLHVEAAMLRTTLRLVRTSVRSEAFLLNRVPGLEFRIYQRAWQLVASGYGKGRA